MEHHLSAQSIYDRLEITLKRIVGEDTKLLTYKNQPLLYLACERIRSFDWQTELWIIITAGFFQVK